MNYKIFIGASTPFKTLPFSEAIKWYTKRNFSHIYVRYQDPFTKDILVAESSHGEHHKILFDKWKIDNKIIHEFEVTVEHDIFVIMVRHINKLLQTPYGILNVIGTPIYDFYAQCKVYKLRKLLEKIYKIFMDGATSVICSESASFLLMLIGVDFNRPYDFIRPDHVVDKLNELCKSRKDIKAIL